jgi:hypothetical protein
LEILQQGGNAFDAAVATAAVMNLVEPVSAGVGGDVFVIAWVAKDKKPGMLCNLCVRKDRGCRALPLSRDPPRKSDGAMVGGKDGAAAAAFGDLLA